MYAYEVYLLSEERKEQDMQQGTSIKKCKEGLVGKLVKGGLEGAGLRT